MDPWPTRGSAGDGGGRGSTRVRSVSTTNVVRVSARHSERIVEALRARGAEVEYLLIETEGHWFINADSNIELYSTLNRFLTRHLGGRTPDAD